jgi:Rab GDP dissociation inhibitor
MANGELTNILVSTDVTRYLEFKQIAGSYVQQGKGPKATVAKVPSDAGEALRSSLMGLFEKRRAKKFLEWVGEFKEEDPATHLGTLVVDPGDRGGRWLIWSRPGHRLLHHEGGL